MRMFIGDKGERSQPARTKGISMKELMHIKIKAVPIIITSQVCQDRPIVGGLSAFWSIYLNKFTLDFLLPVYFLPFFEPQRT